MFAASGWGYQVVSVQIAVILAIKTACEAQHNIT